MRFTVLLISFIGLLYSCTQKYDDDQAIAIYKDKALYLPEIQRAFPENMEEKDSIDLLKKLVDNWLSRQILYDRAMRHSMHDEDVVERKVEQYRQNLVIHQYKKGLLSEKIDTTVTVSQLKKYYDNHNTDFRLTENIARTYFIKVPKSVPNAYNVRIWLNNADNEDVLIKIKEFSYQNARFYDFDNKWQSLSEIKKLIPEEIEDGKKFLERNNVYYKRDSLYYYFMRVNEYLLKGDIAPMEYIVPDLKQIVISKRKLEFINNLENDLKREAHNNKNIKINI